MKLVKCYIWSVAFYGAETWTLRKVDQIYREMSENDASKGCRSSGGPIV
jgi:hypothetical protein